MLAAQNDQEEVIKFLLRKKADVLAKNPGYKAADNITDSAACTIVALLRSATLSQAIEKHNFAEIESLLHRTQNKSIVNEVLENDRLPLTMALELKDDNSGTKEKIVKLLLKQGADIFAVDDFGNSVLSVGVKAQSPSFNLSVRASFYQAMDTRNIEKLKTILQCFPHLFRQIPESQWKNTIKIALSHNKQIPTLLLYAPFCAPMRLALDASVNHNKEEKSDFDRTQTYLEFKQIKIDHIRQEVATMKRSFITGYEIFLLKLGIKIIELDSRSHRCWIASSTRHNLKQKRNGLRFIYQELKNLMYTKITERDFKNLSATSRDRKNSNEYFLLCFWNFFIFLVFLNIKNTDTATYS